MRVSRSILVQQDPLDPRELASVAAAAPDLFSFAEEVLDRCQRAVGFDVAYHAIVSDAPALAARRGFSDARVRLLVERGADYTRELMPVKRAALARDGVAIDSEVLSARERERLAYFVEMMAPDGGRHALIALGVLGRRVVSATMLGRCGSSFSPEDVRALTAIVPVLGLGSAAHSRAVTTAFASVDLTPRERDLVDYVALGLTNSQIGMALGTSPRTVRNQLSALYARVGASNRAELVALLRSPDGR